jgi:hypothetical protein
MNRAFLLAACLFVATPILANDIAVSTDARAIVAQQSQLKAEVETGAERFKSLSPDKRANLLARQNRVLAMLEGRELSTELSQQQQLDLFNELEAISAIVNDAEDERIICERTRPVGSNRPMRVCRTVAQRRAEQSGIEQRLGARDQRCFGRCEAANGNW